LALDSRRKQMPNRLGRLTGQIQDLHFKHSNSINLNLGPGVVGRHLPDGILTRCQMCTSWRTPSLSNFDLFLSVGLSRLPGTWGMQRLLLRSFDANIEHIEFGRNKLTFTNRFVKTRKP